MKQIALLLVLFSIQIVSFAQIEGPREVTPEILKRITAEAEKEAAIFRQGLTDDEWSNDWKDFCADTFKIRQIVAKRMDIDYSTQGMNFTVMEMTKAYDKLMNRYYNKILGLLKPADKKVLITTQKAWLVFRDAELKLIGKLREDEYSGGGSIQSNIAVGRYSDIVEARTLQLFNYYDEIFKEK